MRVGGSCDGWMGLRRAGSVERCLRRLGSVRRRFSFCFVVLMGVLRMILCGLPFLFFVFFFFFVFWFWIWGFASTYELAFGKFIEDQALDSPRMLRPGLIVEVGI